MMYVEYKISHKREFPHDVHMREVVMANGWSDTLMLILLTLLVLAALMLIHWMT